MIWRWIIRRKSRPVSASSSPRSGREHAGLGIDYAVLSTKGGQRESNEDSFGVFPGDPLTLSGKKGRLFILADGMGGHTSGKEASEAAVKIILGNYFTNPQEGNLECLQQAFRKANARIFEISKKRDSEQIMGTTCSALIVAGKMAQIAHVGDSRIYRISGGRMEQLTQDHTEVLDLVKAGLMNKEQAENYPRLHALNRALGVESEVNIDTRPDVPLKRGDCFVLCTDGLALVAPDEIKNIVQTSSAQQASEKLIELSQQLDGGDNATVIVVKLTDEIP